jgi:hypothetical protein
MKSIRFYFERIYEQKKGFCFQLGNTQNLIALSMWRRVKTKRLIISHKTFLCKYLDVNNFHLIYCNIAPKAPVALIVFLEGS